MSIGRWIRQALKQISILDISSKKYTVQSLRLLCSYSSGYIYHFPNTSRNDLPYMPELTTVDSPKVFGVKVYRAGSQRRPESRQSSNPQDVYTEMESKKYSDKPRNVRIQAEMTRMAMGIVSRSIGKKIDLSAMLILDLGCGSGLNLKHIGNVHGENDFVLGVDMNRYMLTRAKDIRNETDSFSPRCVDFVQADLTMLLCIRKGVVDAIVSISVIQWLLRHTARSDNFPNFRDFLVSSAHCLKPGAPAVCQFYPSHPHDLVRVVNIVSEVDAFHAAIICEFPHGNKAKKLFLFLRKK